MGNEHITMADIEAYKQRFLDQTVLVGQEEAAAILSVSLSTVKRRVNEGLLAVYSDTPDRANRRFLASELREYVRRMRTIHRER